MRIDKVCLSCGYPIQAFVLQPCSTEFRGNSQALSVYGPSGATPGICHRGKGQTTHIRALYLLHDGLINRRILGCYLVRIDCSGCFDGVRRCRLLTAAQIRQLGRLGRHVHITDCNEAANCQQTEAQQRQCGQDLSICVRMSSVDAIYVCVHAVPTERFCLSESRQLATTCQQPVACS
jgi:hypothetical protein